MGKVDFWTRMQFLFKGCGYMAVWWSDFHSFLNLFLEATDKHRYTDPKLKKKKKQKKQQQKTNPGELCFQAPGVASVLQRHTVRLGLVRQEKRLAHENYNSTP